MFHRIRQTVGAAFALVCVLGMGNASADDMQTALSNVMSSVNTDTTTGATPAQSLRDEAIVRAATVYGAQNGLYYRWQHIEHLLIKRDHLLLRVFDFGGMYLDGGLVQPPVLDMSSNVTQISHSGQARELVDHIYRVLIPAAFKARPISWRSFLLPDTLAKPAAPSAALLAKNDHENALWKDNIQRGWTQGIKEADSEFSTRLDSLSNAYQGMALYTFLAMRGMVAAPHIVKTDKQVSRDVDGQKMAVGIHHQVIARKSYFVAEPNHWKPVYYQHDFAHQGKA